MFAGVPTAGTYRPAFTQAITEVFGILLYPANCVAGELIERMRSNRETFRQAMLGRGKRPFQTASRAQSGLPIHRSPLRSV